MEKEDYVKKALNKKKYISGILKGQGIYSKEMSMQVSLLAQLWVKTEKLFRETIDADPIAVELSREGYERASVSVKEKLYLDYVDRCQKALKALGMNTDSKEKRSEPDSLNDFLDSFK